MVCVNENGLIVKLIDQNNKNGSDIAQHNKKIITYHQKTDKRSSIQMAKIILYPTYFRFHQSFNLAVQII